MSHTVIQVHDLWKKYRLGMISTGTVAHDLNRWWARVRGKPDPYAKVGEARSAEVSGQKSEVSSQKSAPTSGLTSDLRPLNSGSASTSDLRPLNSGSAATSDLRPPTSPSSSLGDDEIWALRGVSFEVKQGEILGIIGRNGAGKSTLLKILSRTTAPTSGEVRIKGRIASLLEVGTGFHPELTGRENVFLNGAILGMTKAEIKRKFDEIVDFSGVERFIDTPVKRYSSGMYVRLAFAVAAHLEPEILIVDEVLAVGDAEFQKKCLGKMQDVAGHGRTVLFVSHSMPAVSRLTHRCLVLQEGKIDLDGSTPAAVDHYMQLGTHTTSWTHDVSNAPRIPGGTQAARLLELGFSNSTSSFRIGEDLQIEVGIHAIVNVSEMRFHMTVFSSDGTAIGTTCTRDFLELRAGEQRQVLIRFPQPRFTPGRYFCDAALVSGYGYERRIAFDIVPDVLHFEITPLIVNSDAVAHWYDAWGRIALPDMCMDRDGTRNL